MDPKIETRTTIEAFKATEREAVCYAGTSNRVASFALSQCRATDALPGTCRGLARGTARSGMENLSRDCMWCDRNHACGMRA